MEKYIKSFDDYVNESIFHPKEKVRNFHDLYVVTDDRYSTEPFVTTISGFEKYCKEYGWDFDMDALTSALGYPGWERLPVDDNIIILH